MIENALVGGPDHAALQPYIEALEAIPVVEAVRVVGAGGGGRRPEATVELVAAGHTVELGVELKRTRLSRDLAEHVLHRADPPGRTLLLVPSISRAMGESLAERGLNFADLAGNHHLRIVLDGEETPRVYSRLLGTPAPRHPPRARAIRAPGHRVLYALLVEPELVKAPVREIADRSGASRQAVSDMLARLRAERALVRTGRRHVWSAPPETALLDRWVNGYRDTLRPALVLGEYRTPDDDPGLLERRLGRELEGGPRWFWGGSAAGHRLTGQYRGPHTVVHLEGEVDLRSLTYRLEARPDRRGSLTLMRLPGPRAIGEHRDDTVEPFLVYAEMLVEGSERAREAARAVLALALPAAEES